MAIATMSIHEILDEIESGTLVVNREVLSEILDTLSYGPGPWESMDDRYLLELRCQSLVQPHWIALLFDLLLNPPKDYDDFDSAGWDSVVWMLLDSTAQKYPQVGFEDALVLFPGDDERMRAAILATLGGAGNFECFPYVDAYFEQLDQLTRSEMTLLIEAYGGIGGVRSLKRLDEISKRLPDGKMKEWYLTQAIEFAVNAATEKAGRGRDNAPS